MTVFETYVFFDLETTGLIRGKDVPAIIELGMLAVKRRQFLTTRADDELRVQYKFRMCFNPLRSLDEEIFKLTGLSDELLEQEAELNTEAFDAISSFINCLQKPICLIAHNGLKFHFPILKYHLHKIVKQLDISSEVMCTDSLYAFYDLLEEEKRGGGVEGTFEEFKKEHSFEELYREYFFSPGCAPYDSYQLKHIYARECPGADLKGNRAENHCTMMLKIAQRRAESFSRWVFENHCYFDQVPDLSTNKGF